jgi:hypothetical protein
MFGLQIGSLWRTPAAGLSLPTAAAMQMAPGRANTQAGIVTAAWGD